MIASGPYALVTQQSLIGRSRHGGQKVRRLMIIHHFLFQQLSKSIINKGAMLN